MAASAPDAAPGGALAVGIDLGTSYSCVAFVRNGQPVALGDSTGQPIQASVVSFLPNGAVLVGNPAKKRLVIDARNTIASAKRMMGRPFADPVVEEMRRRYFYEIREGIGGLPVIVVRGREFSIPEISAFVLRRIKQIAQDALQAEVGQAVVTVPANFGDAARKATKMAGQLAGLKVLRVINEPTAAALAYGFGRDLNAKLAVYDFGGGTFDFTILDIRGDVFEVVATAGEPYLGGDDFDARLMDYMATAFLRLHRYDLRENEVAMMRLRQVAEQIKIELSSRDQVTARVQEIAHGGGGEPLNLEFTLTRKGLEDKCQDIVQRSFLVCDEALRMAGLKAEQIDHVALVGGTTRMPLVRQMVAQYFGKEPHIDLNPDQVVALGAALQAASLTEAVNLEAMVAESDLLTGAGEEAAGAAATAEEAASEPDAAGAGWGQAAGVFDERAEPPEPTRTAPLPVVQPVPADERGAPAAAPRRVGLAAAPGVEAERDLPAVDGGAGAEVGADGGADGAQGLDAARTAAFARVRLKRTTVTRPPPPPTKRGPLLAPGARSRPVLLDVTPRGLSVATVGGYAEMVIPRNAQIPVEQARQFVTSSDDQAQVRIQVLQGESNRVEDCQKLGELLLSEIPPQARGAVRITVTFEVDTDGMLRVRAHDQSTGRVQKATLSIAGALNEDEMKTLLAAPALPVVAEE
jgi:molecular chaperone DnaK